MMDILIEMLEDIRVYTHLCQVLSEWYFGEQIRKVRGGHVLNVGAYERNIQFMTRAEKISGFCAYNDYKLQILAQHVQII